MPPDPILPLRPPEDVFQRLTDSPAAGRPSSLATVEPLLVSASVAGPMCGRSEASWWRDHSAGRCPAPLKLGGKTLWRVAELRAWVEAGCPDRRAWQAIRDAQTRRAGR